MRIDGEIDMIHKNRGNLLDEAVKIPLQRKPLYAKELVISSSSSNNNNNSKSHNNNLLLINNNVIDEERSSVLDGSSSNDDNNNDYIHRTESAYYKCPVCHLDELGSRELLDDHVKSEHPGFKPSCHDCGEVFASLKLLSIHSAMHVTEKCAIRNNQINLKILNYLENKNALYQKLTDTIETSQSYRCNFCSEHFTGAQFMVHWKQCKHFRSLDDSSDKTRDDSDESDDIKSNFLAGLNLQSSADQRAYSDSGESNRSDSSSKATKLMDAIQNVAATAAMAAASSFPPNPMFFVEEEKTADEDDDPFKMEVRDMKRRGEFPCRICKKIFRNLRALKGHARIHISGNRGIRPYECNICSFNTNDKSVVIRHIRNHNGDHPYKCQLCFSTFTTKANCERHLRNAHRKTSREDIKKLLVDLNNKPAPHTSATTNFKTKLHSLLTANLTEKEGVISNRTKIRENGDVAKPNEHDPEDSGHSNDSNNNTNSVTTDIPQLSKLDDYPLNSLLESEVKYSNFNAAAAAHAAGLIDMRMSRPEAQFYKANYKTYNDVIMSASLIPGMVRDTGLTKTSTPAPPYPGHFLEEAWEDADEPLDLSVDVLDLSKKKDSSENGESGVEDLSVKGRFMSSSASSSCSSPATPPLRNQSHAFFGKNEMCYNFPSPIVSNLSSFLAPTSSAFPGAKMRAEDEPEPRPLLPVPGAAKMPPLTFGQLVANAAERYEAIRHNMTAFAVADYGKKTEVQEHDDKPEEKLDSKYKESTPIKSSRSKSSTVKMVMKDGVLVEKQKQRRYRTEKPFSCAYCSGRFTLRSNMDRHVKQQHPGFWRQRQRGGSSRSLQRKSRDETLDMMVGNISAEATRTSMSDSLATATDTSTRDKRLVESDTEVDVDADDERRSVKKSKREAHQLVDDDDDDDEAAGCEEDDNDEDDDEEEEDLVIDEETPAPALEQGDDRSETSTVAAATLEKEENPDLASVRSLLDNVSTQTFSQYFRSEEDPNNKHDDGSEEDEEGLVAGSSSEGNGSGGEEKLATDSATKSSDKNSDGTKKKKSAYSSAPNRVHCDFCYRSFPWASSLRRHTLTHTGQKPYKCSSCPLLFTTKSNCDRHFLRKHRNQVNESAPSTSLVNPTPAAPAAEGDRSASTTSPLSVPSARLIPNFSTRNVPERPFKCSNCPSSTFSTFQNLKKHIVEKHNQPQPSNEESPAASLVDQHPQQPPQQSPKKDEALVATHHIEENVNDKSEKCGVPEDKEAKTQCDQNFGGHISSDLPFKCHLCDRSFGERQEALDHMSDSHSVEFQHLICKGALDTSVKLEDTANHDDGMVASDENNTEQCRGRFPDYSSRKVICAFCLRRFWSAEDLRRHMRTHTGERPFACDICQRRFTLKHSMLRHRKKHSNKSFTSMSGENSPNSEDEEPASPYNDGRELRVLPAPFAGSDRKGGEPCSGVAEIAGRDFKPAAASVESKSGVGDSFLETAVKMCNKPSVKEDGVDLIAKLLDIDDKELVDEMITSKSADDVAKLLGVQK